MATRNTLLTGNAGEHYVAYRLSGMGYVVALTRGGSPSVDLLVGRPDGKKALSLQVKAKTDALNHYKRRPNQDYLDWELGRHWREFSGPSAFYAFVDLKERERKAGEWGETVLPDVFIVPADVVVEQVSRPGNDSSFPEGQSFKVLVYY